MGFYFVLSIEKDKQHYLNIVLTLLTFPGKLMAIKKRQDQMNDPAF